MRNKIILTSIAGVSVILLGLLISLWFIQKSRESPPPISQPPSISGTVKAGGTEVAKAKLVSIARAYIKTKPTVHLGDQFITWNQAEKAVKNLDVQYFSQNNPNGVYYNLGQVENKQALTEWEKWWNTEAAGKYAVQWDPGCDDYIINLRLEGNEEFISKCLADYRLFVLIDKDLKPIFVDIIQF